MHFVFIISCLFIDQHVVDSIPWCADTLGDYYEEHAGEEISGDFQQAEAERKWRANEVE